MDYKKVDYYIQSNDSCIIIINFNNQLFMTFMTMDVAKSNIKINKKPKKVNNSNTKMTYSKNKNDSKINKINVLEENDKIENFNPTTEYMKMFRFKTSASNIIKKNVLHYAILHINRTNGLLKLSEHIKFSLAEKIELGIFEYTMITISKDNNDVIEFMVNIYEDKIQDICKNLDTHNERIKNYTLRKLLLQKKLDPFFVAFMTPQQLHPVRWAKELERRRVIETTNNEQKVTENYTCRKCGDKKSTTTQTQTRSADEPMTIFVTCLTCHNTFTIN